MCKQNKLIFRKFISIFNFFGRRSSRPFVGAEAVRDGGGNEASQPGKVLQLVYFAENKFIYDPPILEGNARFVPRSL